MASQPSARAKGRSSPSAHFMRVAGNGAPEDSPARAGGCALAGAAISVAAINTLPQLVALLR